MESEERESRWAHQAGHGRAMNGEKSPAGSVKRARQRAAAGLPPEPHPALPMPPAIYTHYASSSPQEGPSPIDPIQYPARTAQAARHTPSPPSFPTQSRSKRGSPSPPLQQDISPILQPNAFQSQPSLRPSRSDETFMTEQERKFRQASQSSQNQSHGPESQIQSPVNYWEDSYSRPSSLDRYSSGSSRPSTVATGSSTASIPEFPTINSGSQMPPMPLVQPPPRRNLGPPPSARKGYSSYYSQTSIVIPPIPEEKSDVNSHSSFASTRPPIDSWVDGPSQFYLSQNVDEGEEEGEEDQTDGNSSGRQSRAGDHDDSSNLVRKGSRGKPLQPFMETLESGDESDIPGRRQRIARESDWQGKQDEGFRPGFAAGTDPIGRHNFRKDSRLYSAYDSDVAFLDSPGSGSPNGSRTPQVFARSPYSGSPSGARSPVDPRVDEILGNLEKGGALSSSGTTSRSASVSASEKGLKRPPRLDLAANAKEPGKASQSSLPELIRRATRLATNLDRGNTESRVGMLEALNAKDHERELKGSQTGSLSDIIASFPSPSPTIASAPRPPNWGASSPHGKSNLSRSQTMTYGSSRRYDRRRAQRCCGMPIWAFLLLSIILLLLIAAAVIIPVTLIVVPRESKSSSGISAASCEKSDPCGNGGTSLVSSNQCRCICANGYTGSACVTAPDSGCTTITIGANPSYQKATLGTSIPRLLTNAQPNFTIPLGGVSIASLFSFTNLSCASENALVTFDQKSQKQRRSAESGHSVRLFDLPTKVEDRFRLFSPFHALQYLYQEEETLPTRVRPRASAQTSNNIIFAAPSNVAAATGTNAASAASTSGATSLGQTPPVETTVVSGTILDFARIAVLFIFQETSSLQTATTALEKLQALLNGGVGSKFDASQTSAGGNITVDLTSFTVGFGNGTLFGGRAGR